MDKRKIIVVNAVNIVDGGALVVLKDAIKSLHSELDDKFKMLCLVNSKELFKDISLPKARFIPFPAIKKHWMSRIFFEYYTTSKLSQRLDVDIWIDMHDISSNVKANFKYVYCHNPSIFYTPSLFDLLYEPKIVAFSFLYKFLYRINIKKNTHVFVQQHWIADKFRELFLLDNLVVARPSINIDNNIDNNINSNIIDLVKVDDKSKLIFYPAYPRVFKNFEVIAKCAELCVKNGKNYHFLFTIDGSENAYSRYLYGKYKHLNNIHWVGLKAHGVINYIYTKTDIVCFPSKLETWGLPISEAASFDIKLCCSDLPYAHETVGSYSKVNFFNPDCPESLYTALNSSLSGNHDGNESKLSDMFSISGWSEFAKFIVHRGMI